MPSAYAATIASLEQGAALMPHEDRCPACGDQLIYTEDFDADTGMPEQAYYCCPSCDFREGVRLPEPEEQP